MSRSENQKRKAKNTSRREFLAAALKGGSVAALIAGGGLDSLLAELLAFQEGREEQTYLSPEALQGILPNKSLKVIRNLLKGEHFPGGRFWVEGKIYASKNGRPCSPVCDPVGPIEGATCPSAWDCPKQKGCTGNCNDQGCASYRCSKEHTCPDGFGCPGTFLCEAGADICGNVTCGEVVVGYNSPERITAFDIADISAHPTIPFVRELMKVMGLRSTQALEHEVANMIKGRQTLRMKGYMK